MKLTPFERFHITRLLPQEGGSLSEAIRINRMREEIGLEDWELEAIMKKDEQGNNLNEVNVEAIESLEGKEYSFDEEERRIIGLRILMLEEERSVPTGNSFIDLVQKFEDGIDAAREILDGTNNNPDF